jgi:aryl-alcohol dehydrogenase-like predicted oxidoreductase
MNPKDNSFSRRDFFKITGAAGIGSIAGSMANIARASDSSESGAPGLSKVPTRPFGKTGVNVSILSLGGTYNLKSRQLLLRQALKMGVTYWDTANSYSGGNSELGIGKYFARYPDDRRKVFLVTKSGSSDPDDLTADLHASLERMQTSSVDLFFIHAVSDVRDEVDRPAIKAWAERAKGEGKIRLFGFSTHKNMEQCLLDASRLGWIDGIMASYNYRLMNKPQMKMAADACIQAGIGLTAMKTQATFLYNLYSDVFREEESASRLTEQFMARGFTPEQAKLKAVWENPHIASICSNTPNLTYLQANVAAALNKTALSFEDHRILNQYAAETACGYCAGCARLCESSVTADIPISDVMRYLMYYHNYGNRRQAAEKFGRILESSRRRLAEVDYSGAERECPQNIPIGQFMQLAVDTFSGGRKG